MKAATALLGTLVLAFLMAPMLAAAWLSLSPTELLRFPPPTLSLRWYAELAASERWALAARNSALVGAGATLLATTTGTLAAIGLHLARFPGRGVLLALCGLPIVVPYIVTAAALFFAFSAIGLAGTLAGLVIAHAILGVPFVVIAVLAALRGFDPLLWRAAAASGATPLTAIHRVVLPAVRPGVASGAVFAFAVSLDEFIVTLFLAGPGQFTLPRQIYGSVREFLSPTILAAATLLFGVSLLLLLLAEAARPRR